MTLPPPPSQPPAPAQPSTAAPPEGFLPVQLGGTFATQVVALFARWHEHHLQLGFHVGVLHLNPGGVCHGGMLSTFADILISTAAQYQTDISRVFLPTINLSTEFLAPAPRGAWVQGQADILKVTRKLVFSQGLVYADGDIILRCSGVFRRGPLLPDSADDPTLRLPGMPHRSG